MCDVDAFSATPTAGRIWKEILDIIPGRVSTEVDHNACLSFNQEATKKKGGE